MPKKATKKKPVKKGAKHAIKKKSAKPTKGHKGKMRARLVSKGVPLTDAERITGELENLTAEEIATRRIAWQKNLPKA